MCWSKTVSGITFILGIAGCIYLFQRNGPNDRWIAVFGATVIMIQLAEYFMWSEPVCGSKLNKYACVFALVMLLMEPLVAILGGLIFSDTANKPVLLGFLGAYIVFVVIIYFKEVRGKKPIQWCAQPKNRAGQCKTGASSAFNKKGCNLSWSFMEHFSQMSEIIWMGFLLLPLLTMVPFKQGLILALLGLGTFGLAAVINSSAIGSLWCWFAIFVIYAKVFFLK
jgi:hypothetical protein